MPPLESFAKPQRDALSSWLVRNPGYKMRYFGLDDSRLYLKKHFHPIFLRAFDCIEPFAGKSDIFRAAIIYREGGYYSDFKEQLQVDGLLDLMANSSKPKPTAIISWDRGTPHARQNYYLMTGFFGAIAEHPIYAQVLKNIVRNVQNQFYGTVSTDPTGPGVYGEAFKTMNSYERKQEMKEYPMQSVRYQWNFYYYRPYNASVRVIAHKYEGANLKPKKQLRIESWTNNGGNDYRELYKQKRFYCPGASQLFDYGTEILHV